MLILFPFVPVTCRMDLFSCSAHVLFSMFSPTDPSLTLTNLTQLLEDVRNLEQVILYLDVSLSVRNSIYTQQSSVSERKKAYWEWYLNNHPCPSWRHIANALYMNKEHGVLEVLKSRYLKGESGSL